ncbi:MAG TPA: hypothetical protein ENI85_04500, partial [Deltaproteobacteria bacterium]|nr:hypothetical protein [Deltaproteobacteria bacterium]
MRRVVPFLLSLAIVAGALLIPKGVPAELSALESYQLLELPVGPPPAEGQTDDRPPLWKAVLDSPAAERTEDGLVLRLHGTRHVPAPEFGGDPILLHGTVRTSLIRGFRQFSQAAQDPRYHSLRIDEVPTETWGANFDFEFTGDHQRIHFGIDLPEGAFEPVTVEREWTPPTRDSIVPPIVAVVLAILLRRPLIALILAVFSGAFLLRHDGGASWVASIGGGAADVVTHYFHEQLVDLDRLEIIGFVFFMLAMVGVMTRAGGIRGLMDVVAARAKDAKGTQFATYLMGLVVFFDDYANTILVGSTMRPLTDRFRISREKLSYIVDSTAAPVAGLSIFSTWIAFEVSTFNGQLPAAGLDVGDGYAVFLRTVPYSFYCFLTIFFVGLVTLSRRDFGPMLAAERRARSTGKVIADGATPMVAEEATAMEPAPHVTASAWRAVLPLATFMAVTLVSILLQGGIASLPA